MNATNKPDDFCGESLQRTFHVLATTANSCADATLITALDSRWAEVVTAAARALLARNSTPGQEAILKHWTSFQGMITPILIQFPSRMTACVSKRLDGQDLESARLGLRVAVEIGEYDLVPKILRHAENPKSAIQRDAVEALFALCKQLFEETHGRRSYARKRDPQLARTRVLQELENSLGRFEKHKSATILTCFLTLAGRDHVYVGRLLSQSAGASLVQAEALKLLRTSESNGVMRLLASFLDDPSAPLMGLQIAAQRSDAAFVEECLRRIDSADRDTLQKNLKKVPAWQWLEKGPTRWTELYESEQATAVTWMTLSGMPDSRKMATFQWVMEQGRVGARIRAAEALANFSGDAANALVQKHLGDSDARVRAALLSQLRPRLLPGSVSRLIASLVDPDPEVRQTVQKQLPEFKFRRYLDLFDSMDPAVQQANGKIVKRVDPDWRAQLELELKAEMRLRKLRGLRIANCMEAGNEVFQAVLPFASDAEALTRQEAIAVLGHSDAPQAVEAIRQALLDPQIIVRRAAEEVLRNKQTSRGEKSGVSAPARLAAARA